MYSSIKSIQRTDQNAQKPTVQSTMTATSAMQVKLIDSEPCFIDLYSAMSVSGVIKVKGNTQNDPWIKGRSILMNP